MHAKAEERLAQWEVFADEEEPDPKMTLKEARAEIMRLKVQMSDFLSAAYDGKLFDDDDIEGCMCGLVYGVVFALAMDIRNSFDLFTIDDMNALEKLVDTYLKFKARSSNRTIGDNEGRGNSNEN